MSQVKSTSTNGRAVVAVLIGALLAIGPAACGSKEKAATPSTPEAKILAAGAKELKDVKVTAGDVVSIEWTVRENLTEGLTKDTLRLEATDALEAVQKSGVPYTAVHLTPKYTLVDQLGNESLDTVMRGSWPAEVVSDINWDGFNFKNVTEIVPDVWVHPAFVY